MQHNFWGFIFVSSFDSRSSSVFISLVRVRYNDNDAFISEHIRLALTFIANTVRDVSIIN